MGEARGDAAGPGLGAGDAHVEGAQQRQIRGSALLVLGRVLALVIALATQVIMVRSLSKSDFGAFEYAITLAGSARILLSLGQGRLLSRFMATYDEQGDHPRMFGAMLLAVGTIVATSVPLIAALYLFPDELIGSAVDGDDGTRLVLLLIFLSPLEALDQVFVSLFAVFTKPTAIFFRKYLLAPGLRFVVVLVLALSNASVMFLAVGYLLAAAAGIGLYVVLFVAALRERDLLGKFRLREIVFPFRDVFEFSFPLITGELSLLSLKMGGVVVLAHLHSMVEVADYRVAFGPARLNTSITASFATLFLPIIARLHTRGDMDGLRSTYWNTAAFVAVFTFPIFALTGPLAPATTVAMFGERYAGSATVLSVLAVGYYLNVVLGFNTYALQVCGRIRWLVGVNLFVAVFNIGLCFALAPELGAVGIAAANCIALTSQNLLNQWALRGSIATACVDRSCWTCYALIVGGAALLAAFEWLVAPGIVASVVAAAVVSLLVLWGSQPALQLSATFPELQRLPLVGRLVR
ncbi:oligosaccharide flippase family protein [Nocardioides caldifontis]|uniref:oligosaccharide flippase family protein n=1 Tax=Nocardioides caldifontis TaxID=2588938 RepID=UPI0011DF0433|nr:oligosaccharide flippase family protein [Nocardioides caldifontis]